MMAYIMVAYIHFSWVRTVGDTDFPLKSYWYIVTLIQRPSSFIFGESRFVGKKENQPIERIIFRASHPEVNKLRLYVTWEVA